MIAYRATTDERSGERRGAVILGHGDDAAACVFTAATMGILRAQDVR